MPRRKPDPELPIPDKEKAILADIYRTLRKMYGTAKPTKARPKASSKRAGRKPKRKGR